MNRDIIKNYYLKNIKNGKIDEITIYGSSMLPTFLSGQKVKIRQFDSLNVGDIAVINDALAQHFVVHRIVEIKKDLVCALGDNQTDAEKQWFKQSDIIAVAVSKKEQSLLGKKAIVIDLPFHQATRFDSKTYEIFQSLKMDYAKAKYCDWNLDFNYSVYTTQAISKYITSNNYSQEECVSFFNYMENRRKIFKYNYNLHRFINSTLIPYDPTSSESVADSYCNYKTSIYYNFFKESLRKVLAIVKVPQKYKYANLHNRKLMCRCGNFKGQLPDFYVTVSEIYNLYSAVIFSQVLYETLKIKPILIDNSRIFGGNYDTSFYNNFFKAITASSQVYGKHLDTKPTYEQINFNKYISKFKIGSLHFTNECYYKKCIFCDRHCRDNFYFSVDNLFDKISELYFKHKVTNFIFDDDCIPIPLMKSLCEKLQHNNIKIKWKGTFRFESILNNEQLIKLFSENGCKMMFLGLESFDQKMLDYMNKNITIEDVINILKLCKKYGIKTSVSFIFGLPKETKSSLQTTLKQLKNNINLIDYCEFNFFQNTKNCKLNNNKLGLNYIDETKTNLTKNMPLIKKILNFANKNGKNMSFFDKNVGIWLN